ncbi:MAG: LuxR C-terminal-related transcriptional regulator [Thermomicrobiales bacterium]
MPTHDGWLSATEAAELLGVSQRTVRRAIERGALRATKHSGVYHIAPTELERFRELRSSNISHEFQARRARLTKLREWHPDVFSTLPRTLTPLIGRELELAAVQDLVRSDGVRLVTLTGPGGVGKTRLALHSAENLAKEFADGICFVDLAPIRDVDLVPSVVARSLGLHEMGKRPALELLRRFLRHRDLLLVLDNTEHLLPAAPLIADLLFHSPRLKVMATSREILRLSGEHNVVVGPLCGPQTGQPANQADAVRLFVARARASQPRFELTPGNAPIVVEICHRLDGLPLAIELAAARLTHLSPVELLTRLEPRLPLLTGGPRDLPERQQTMQNTIGWSHALLSEEEQVLFRRLSVFVGGFTLESAEALSQSIWRTKTDGDARTESQHSSQSLLDGVASLVAKSLLRQEIVFDEGAAEESTRYTMLETVREFGQVKLTDSGEEEQLRSAHAACFLALAERTAPQLIGSRVRAEVAVLEREYANLHAAMTWLEARGQGETLLRLATAIIYFWEVTGRWTEGTSWLERALAADASVSPARVDALASMALTYSYRGDETRAEQFVREAVELACRLGSTRQTADVMLVRGGILVDQGRYGDAERVLGEAAALAHQASDPDLEALALVQSARAAWGRDERAVVTDRVERAIELWESMGFPYGVGIASRFAAAIALESGDFAKAAEGYRLYLAAAPDSVFLLARTLPEVAALAAGIGQPELAARLFGAGAGLAESIGYVPAFPERAKQERWWLAVQSTLGNQAAGTAYASGKQLSHQDIRNQLATLLEIGSSPGTTPPGTQVIFDKRGLTARELEVLRLLAQRQSDLEIADQLFITRRTASKHVSAILAKLGVPNRRAAAAEAGRLGLV